MLTLVCKVKGSDHLQFRWLKDGAAIDVHRAQRNVWETLIPSSDGETRMSVLNIDKCDRLDSGESWRDDTEIYEVSRSTTLDH